MNSRPSPSSLLASRLVPRLGSLVSSCRLVPLLVSSSFSSGSSRASGTARHDKMSVEQGKTVPNEKHRPQDKQKTRRMSETIDGTQNKTRTTRMARRKTRTWHSKTSGEQSETVPNEKHRLWASGKSDTQWQDAERKRRTKNEERHRARDDKARRKGGIQDGTQTPNTRRKTRRQAASRTKRRPV